MGLKIQIISMIVVKGKFSDMKFSLAPLNPIILSPMLTLIGLKKSKLFYDSCLKEILKHGIPFSLLNPIILSPILTLLGSNGVKWGCYPLTNYCN